MDLRKILDAIGMCTLERHYAEFVALGTEMADRAVSGEPGPAFAHDASCVSANSPPAKLRCRLLVIDVGGSHTKVGLAERQASGDQRWQTLLDRPNEDFDIGDAGVLPIERFTRALAQFIEDALPGPPGGRRQIGGVGVIWSNALRSVRLAEGPGPTRGVSGLITGVETAKSYRKGEFFVKGLTDGYDIGRAFLATLADRGIVPRAFVVGNDTVFTLKACDNADGGMVASTGANATDVDQDGWIYNTEMGGLCPIPAEWLSEGDKILLAARPEGSGVALEDLMAGKWLPRIFEGHVLALAEQGLPELQPLAEEIRRHVAEGSDLFGGEDLTRLLQRRSTPVLEQLPGGVWNDRSRELARELLAALVARAGKLAAAMAYFSLLHRLATKDHVVLSLDSSQARFLPGYLDAMRQALDGLIGAGKRATVLLQNPEGDITVPMKGLAATLAGELAVAEGM